jgi:hypothetical protein
MRLNSVRWAYIRNGEMSNDLYWRVDKEVQSIEHHCDHKQSSFSVILKEKVRLNYYVEFTASFG